MAPRMTIGDFSQATRLSAKTLRFYHHAGLLEPASIDPSNRYRLYDADQIGDAQVIRQLRSLSVPIDTIRDILLTSEVSTRNSLISAHLERLESQLDATRAAVASLRSLLETTPAHVSVEHRSVPATPVLAIRQTIDLTELSAWYMAARRDLKAAATLRGSEPVGPRGGIWATELFLHERGEAMLFHPVASWEGVGTPVGRVRAEVLPATDLAIAVHRGPDETIGQSYGALGEHVAKREIGIDGPIRENYLAEPTRDSPDVVTEIGWPIFRAAR